MNNDVTLILLQSTNAIVHPFKYDLIALMLLQLLFFGTIHKWMIFEEHAHFSCIYNKWG